jgi:hypothetical protein
VKGRVRALVFRLREPTGGDETSDNKQLQASFATLTTTYMAR